MKLAFESRLEYLTECLNFHERRMTEIWSELTSEKPLDKGEYNQLLERYCDHKRQVKWFKHKLNEPFRATVAAPKPITATLPSNLTDNRVEILELKVATPQQQVFEDEVRPTAGIRKPASGWLKSLWAKIKGEK